MNIVVFILLALSATTYAQTNPGSFECGPLTVTEAMKIDTIGTIDTILGDTSRERIIPARMKVVIGKSTPARRSNGEIIEDIFNISGAKIIVSTKNENFTVKYESGTYYRAFSTYKFGMNTFSAYADNFFTFNSNRTMVSYVRDSRNGLVYLSGCY